MLSVVLGALGVRASQTRAIAINTNRSKIVAYTSTGSYRGAAFGLAVCVTGPGAAGAAAGPAGPLCQPGGCLGCHQALPTGAAGQQVPAGAPHAAAVQLTGQGPSQGGEWVTGVGAVCVAVCLGVHP